MNVYPDYIVEWLDEHDARVLDASFSSFLNAYLNTLPWVASHIDWSTIKWTSLKMPMNVDTKFIDKCRETPLGSHRHVLIMYAPEEPSILCRLEDAIIDLDLLYSHAPGPRYFCGADVDGEEVTLSCTSFAEFDGFSEIIFAIIEGERA